MIFEMPLHDVGMENNPALDMFPWVLCEEVGGGNIPYTKQYTQNIPCVTPRLSQRMF